MIALVLWKCNCRFIMVTDHLSLCIHLCSFACVHKRKLYCFMILLVEARRNSSFPKRRVQIRLYRTNLFCLSWQWLVQFADSVMHGAAAYKAAYHRSLITNTPSTLQQVVLEQETRKCLHLCKDRLPLCQPLHLSSPRQPRRTRRLAQEAHGTRVAPLLLRQSQGPYCADFTTDNRHRIALMSFTSWSTQSLTLAQRPISAVACAEAINSIVS